MVVSGSTTAVYAVLALCGLLELTACVHQQTLYDSGGIQVGIITDLSVDDRTSPPILNKHPAQVTPQEIRALMSALQVSGWSGVIGGLLSAAQPRPVFTNAELTLLAEPLVAAFHAATAQDRVFFSVKNLETPYDTDRTAGSLFFRDDYLHVVLTDHYALLKADPGGDEKKDPRDFKGMKLWLAPPAQAAKLPHDKEPRWGPFEEVHISFKPTELLAERITPDASTASSPRQAPLPASALPAGQASPSAPPAADPLDDLRSQMKEQAAMIEEIKTELEQLRRENNSDNSRPSRKRQAPLKPPLR